MKRKRLASWMVFLGFLIWVTGIGLMQSLASEWQSFNGAQQQQKISVSVNAAQNFQGNAGLTWNDAESLERVWGKAVSFQSRSIQDVQFKSRQLSSEIIGANASYSSFNQLWFQKGAMFSQKSVAEHSRVVAVSADFAESLFHSQNVINLIIRIWNETFAITGVYRGNNSLMQTMSGNDLPDLIVPITAWLDFEPEGKITTMELAAAADNDIIGERQASAALTAIGKNPAQFNIRNFSLETKKMANKRQLPLTLIGIASILICLQLMIYRLRQAIRIFRQGLIAKDAIDVWKEAWKPITVNLLGFAGALGGVIWTGMLIAFAFYIPPDWIPARLIDLSYYQAQFQSYWQHQTEMLGYVPSLHEVWLARLNLLTNLLTGAVLFLGLPLFIFGIREWMARHLSIPNVLNRISCYMLLSYAFYWLTANWAGLSLQANWKTFVLWFIFLFCCLYYFRHVPKKNLKE